MASSSVKKTPLLCRGHSRPIPQFAYSQVVEDGNFYVVSSCLDGKPMLRNGKTGDWIGTFVGHKGAVWCSRFDSPATKVATASADYSAKIWDAITGEEKCSLLHSKVVKTVDFANDDQRLITGGVDRYLRLFDLNQPNNEPAIWDTQSDSVKTVLWLENESLFVSLCSNGFVHLWDVRVADQIRKIETKTPCTNISLTNDKKMLVTVGNRHLSFCDTLTFEKEISFPLFSPAVCATVDSGVSPSTIVTGSPDNWIRVYSFEDGKELEVIKGHHGPVNHVAFAPDTKTYASGSDDGTIRLWLAQEMAYGLWELCTEPPSPYSSSNSEPGADSGDISRRNSFGSKWGPSPSASPSTSQNRHHHYNQHRARSSSRTKAT